MTFLAVCCLVIFLASCSKNAIQKNPDLSGLSIKKSFALSTTNTNGFRGINWADPNGNDGDGRVILPSGMTTSLTATQAATVGTHPYFHCS